MIIVKSKRLSARIFQWIARILGILLSAIFILIFLPEGFKFEGNLEEYAEIIPTLIVMSFWISFFISAWFNELVGAIGTVMWAIIWVFPIYFTSGHNKLVFAVLIPSPYLLVGVIFLVAFLLEDAYQRKQQN